MLFSRSVNIILNIFINFLTIFKLLFIFLFDTFEAFVIILIIFCNSFLIFYSIFELYLQLSKAIDHIHRYENPKFMYMLQTIFSRTDIFLLFVICITFLSSLILTICNCIKNAVITFALATILSILFLEEYYNKHKFFHLKKSIKNP